MSAGLWRNPAFVAGLRRAAVAWRATGVPTAGLGATTIDVSLAGEVGDLMVMAVTVRGAVSIATPAGWGVASSFAVSFLTTVVFMRIREAGDGALVTVTVNASSSQTTIGQVVAFSGAGAVGVVGTALADIATSPDIGPIPGIAVGAGSAVVVVGSRSDDFGAVADLSGEGLTWGLAWAATDSGGDAGQAIAWAEASGAVSVAAKTFATDTSATVRRGGVMLEVTP